MTEAIQPLHELPLDQLFLKLGKALRGKYLLEDGTLVDIEFSTDPTEQEETQYGSSAFQRVKPKLREILCDDWDACEKIKKYTGPDGNTQLAAAIFSALEAYLIGLPLSVIAAIIVQNGVKKLCNCR